MAVETYAKFHIDFVFIHIVRAQLTAKYLNLCENLLGKKKKKKKKYGGMRQDRTNMNMRHDTVSIFI